MPKKNLESILKETKDFQTELEKNRGTHELNMPHHSTLLEQSRDYWKNLKPKSAKEAAAAIVSPGVYSLWKLPPELHEYVNTTLKYATEILAETQPEAAVATGIVYGISEIMYGIKTGSGKRLISGLAGTLHHMENSNHEEAREFSRNTFSSLRDYFATFSKKKPNIKSERKAA